MADESPLGRSEERVHLDIRSSGTSAQPAVLVLDEQLANQRFAETRLMLALPLPCLFRNTHFDIWGAPAWSGNGMSSLRMFANVAFRFLPLKGVVPYNIS